jgi:hypothetical protein
VQGDEEVASDAGHEGSIRDEDGHRRST